MPFIESPSEFAGRQKCESLRIGSTRLFANGAQILIGSGGMIDPPVDASALAELKHRFLAAKLEAKISDYNNLKQTVGTQAEWHGMGAAPSAEAVFPGWQEHLEGLAKEIEAMLPEVAKLASELPHNVRAEAYEYQQRQRAQRASATIDTLQQLPNF